MEGDFAPGQRRVPGDLVDQRSLSSQKRGTANRRDCRAESWRAGRDIQHSATKCSWAVNASAIALASCARVAKLVIVAFANRYASLRTSSSGIRSEGLSGRDLER